MNRNSSDILIIDDDPLVRMNYSDIIEDAGFNPSEAENLAQAWNVLQHRNFDLIICDNDLTDGKGVDLLERLIDAGNNIPVIYLSAALPAVLERAGKLSTVKKTLTKPVSKEALLDAIAEHSEQGDGEEHYPKLIGNGERSLLLENI